MWNFHAAIADYSPETLTMVIPKSNLLSIFVNHLAKPSQRDNREKRARPSGPRFLADQIVRLTISVEEIPLGEYKVEGSKEENGQWFYRLKALGEAAKEESPWIPEACLLEPAPG